MVHDEIRRTIGLGNAKALVIAATVPCSPGFTKLNEMVQLRMTRWLIGMATRELEPEPPSTA